MVDERRDNYNKTSLGKQKNGRQLLVVGTHDILLSRFRKVSCPVGGEGPCLDSDSALLLELPCPLGPSSGWVFHVLYSMAVPEEDIGEFILHEGCTTFTACFLLVQA